MKFVPVNLIFGFIISRGHGFLTITDPLTSQSGTSSVSKLQNGLLSVYNFLDEEKALRRQLERIVLNMKQEMVELKANNATGLKEDNNELKKTIQTMQHTTLELKQELGNLTQENINLKHENVDLKQMINVMNSSIETLKLSVTSQQQEIANQSSENCSCFLKTKCKNSQIQTINHNGPNQKYKRILGYATFQSSDWLRFKFTSTEVGTEFANAVYECGSCISDSVHYTDKHDTYVVVFSARSSGGTVGVGKVVPFNRVVTNEGKGYNETDNKFYCSLPGLYLFQATLVNAAAGGRMKIVQNGNEKLSIYSGQASDYESGSGTVFIRLLVGDQVWVAGNPGLYVDATSSFSGALIAT